MLISIFVDPIFALAGFLGRERRAHAFRCPRGPTYTAGARGQRADLELIGQTRPYLRDFTNAVKRDYATSVGPRLLAKVPQLSRAAVLNCVSIPASFPAALQKTCAPQSSVWP